MFGQIIEKNTRVRLKIVGTRVDATEIVCVPLLITASSLCCNFHSVTGHALFFSPLWPLPCLLTLSPALIVRNWYNQRRPPRRHRLGFSPGPAVPLSWRYKLPPSRTSKSRICPAQETAIELLPTPPTPTRHRHPSRILCRSALTSNHLSRWLTASHPHPAICNTSVISTAFLDQCVNVNLHASGLFLGFGVPWLCDYQALGSLQGEGGQDVYWAWFRDWLVSLPSAFLGGWYRAEMFRTL